MSMQNYEIIRKLGQGSYGSVYLARQRDSGRQCVMKRMVLRSLNSKERESAFQEARVLRDLSHPNIVAYIDTQATASKLYLFMQFCDGGDLRMSKAPLSLGSAAARRPASFAWHGWLWVATCAQEERSRRSELDERPRHGHRPRPKSRIPRRFHHRRQAVRSTGG